MTPKINISARKFSRIEVNQKKGSNLPKVPTVEMDGQRLVGREWIVPDDYLVDDIEAGRLVSLKGTTPATLPELESRTETTSTEVW